jgi:hypothetical protein
MMRPTPNTLSQAAALGIGRTGVVVEAPFFRNLRKASFGFLAEHFVSSSSSRHWKNRSGRGGNLLQKLEEGILRVPYCKQIESTEIDRKP